MAGHGVGGKGRLLGASGPGIMSLLRGDADCRSGNSLGGNDALCSGGNGAATALLGDAATMRDNAVDVFVFRPADGEATIHDFGQGRDLIDLRTFGRPWSPWDFDDLSIAGTAGESVVSFGGGNTMTVAGIPGLASDDFRFHSHLGLSDLLVG